MNLKLASVITLAFTTINFAFGAEVATCNATLAFPGEASIETSISITKIKKEYKGSVVQRKNGQEIQKFEDKATFSSNVVRPGLELIDLHANNDHLKLNSAEQLIVHAMFISSMPEMNIHLSFNLKDIKKANVYQVGSSNIGSTSLIEAFDADGIKLGSFIGGFLVSECK